MSKKEHMREKKLEKTYFIDFKKVERPMKVPKDLFDYIQEVFPEGQLKTWKIGPNKDTEKLILPDDLGPEVRMFVRDYFIGVKSERKETTDN